MMRQNLEGKDPIQVKIMVLEKGSDIGAHGISGAVLDPRALDELYPGWKEDETFPVERFVERECMLMLSETSGFMSCILPPEFHDKGKPIISIATKRGWQIDVRNEVLKYSRYCRKSCFIQR